MRFGTVLMFVLAFVCAGVAALLVRASITSESDTKVTSVQPAPPPATTKTVVVAVRDIKPGERLTPEMVREARWPTEMVPKGAFFSKDTLVRAGEERVFSVAISENEPIVVQRLVGNSDNGLAARLNEGMRGVTIKVNDASSVGGFVQAEDRVDVLLTQTERPGEIGSTSHAYTKTLLQNVRVLAVDQVTERKQQAQPPKTVTLEVKEEESKKLTLAGNIGLLSLALSKGGKQKMTSGPVDMRDILDQPGDKDALGANGPVVSVVRSVERKDYKVPQEQK